MVPNFMAVSNHFSNSKTTFRKPGFLSFLLIFIGVGLDSQKLLFTEKLFIIIYLFTADVYS